MNARSTTQYSRPPSDYHTSINRPMLEYPITRRFKWRWFTPITLVGAFFVLVLLVLLNIPLTGYETVTVFQSDFNATTSHWYYRFMPFLIPKPGSTCDPYIFNVGDAFTGDYSFFQWQVDSVIQPTAGDSSIAYKGAPLTSCDVSSVYIDGNLLLWNVDFTVIMTCADSSLNITARTDFAISQLPGRYSPLLGLIRYFNNGTTDTRGAVLNGVIQQATQDLGTRAYSAYLGSNFTSPVITSIQAQFQPCPMSVGNTGCAMVPPVFEIQYAAIGYNNAIMLQYDYNFEQNPQSVPPFLGADVAGPIANLLQAVYAAVRIDLGNPSPNNFILHPSAMNNTIIPIFAATPYSSNISSRVASLYDIWAHPNATLQQFLPVTLDGPAHIQAAYPCRIQTRKRTGSLIISVLVATLSMFSGGWALFMIIATLLAKREDLSANRCVGHGDGDGTAAGPHWRDYQAVDDRRPASRTESLSLKSLTKDHVYEPVNLV